MEIIITVFTAIIAIVFGVVIYKLATHPTSGKVQNYYRDRYHDQSRRNLPPF